MAVRAPCANVWAVQGRCPRNQTTWQTTFLPHGVFHCVSGDLGRTSPRTPRSQRPRIARGNNTRAMAAHPTDASQTADHPCKPSRYGMHDGVTNNKVNAAILPRASAVPARSTPAMSASSAYATPCLAQLQMADLTRMTPRRVEFEALCKLRPRPVRENVGIF